MRKEVILAIIIGIILGAVVLYGLKIANQTVENQNTETTQLTPTMSPTPLPTPTETLTIDTPSNHSVSFTPTINLKGKTKPLTPIAITVETIDDIIQSDDQGNFSTEVTLIGGENLITLSIPTQDGTTSSKSITVIYTSSAIEN